MEQKTLEAESRSEFKKGPSRRLRKAGKIPAVIYGHSGNSQISVDAHDFRTKFKTVSENTIISLTVGEDTFEVLVKDYQEDILSDTITHIDFYEIEAGKMLRTNIPVRLEGTPAGVLEGGVLDQLLYNLEVECLPKDIPEEILLDVNDLGIGNSVHVSDISVADGVRILTPDEQVIVSITTIKEEVEEEVEEEGEEGEGIEGEEGEEGEGTEGEEGAEEAEE